MSNAGLLDSIIVAREQERRRAVMMAAASRAALGSQSMMTSNEAAALLNADHQRNLLLHGMLGGGGGLLGAPPPPYGSFGSPGGLGSLGGLSSLGSLGGLSSLGGLGALQRGSSLGALSGVPGVGVHASHNGLLREEIGDSRLTMRTETPVGGGIGNLRSSSPDTFLRTVRQQRGSRPANFAGDSIILDAMERTGRKGRTGTFPQKLYKALTDLEKEGRTDIACWLPNGSAFVITNPRAFDEDVMRKYFRMNHFSSFQRQCNLYEFGRVTEGPDKGAYFHELFHRGRPILASQIRRNKIKSETNSTGVKSEGTVNSPSPATMPSPTPPPASAGVMTTASGDGVVSSFLKTKKGSTPMAPRAGDGESSVDHAESASSDDDDEASGVE